jgi:hypothetical protein
MLPLIGIILIILLVLLCVLLIIFSYYRAYIWMKYIRYAYKQKPLEDKSLLDKIKTYDPRLTKFSIQEGDDEVIKDYKLKMKALTKYLYVMMALLILTIILLTIINL